MAKSKRRGINLQGGTLSDVPSVFESLPLQNVSESRRFHGVEEPAFRPADAVSRLRDRPIRRWYALAERLPAPPVPRVHRFEDVRQVLECVRRHSRREVLFARQVAGRRGRSPGRRGHYRRNGGSSYGC